MEADPSHVEMLIKDTGTEEARTLSSTGAKSEANDNDEDIDESEGEVLGRSRATAYRSNVARMNYLNTDRPDIAFADKELARKMNKPSAEDEQRVKRLARYLKGGQSQSSHVVQVSRYAGIHPGLRR